MPQGVLDRTAVRDDVVQSGGFGRGESHVAHGSGAQRLSAPRLARAPSLSVNTADIRARAHTRAAEAL